MWLVKEIGGRGLSHLVDPVEGNWRACLVGLRALPGGPVRRITHKLGWRACLLPDGGGHRWTALLCGVLPGP